MRAVLADDMPWSLRDVNCFHGLSPVQVEEVTALFQKRGYRPGERIVGDDRPGDQIFLVRRGRVRLFLQDPHDPGVREVTFDLVEPGGIFGVSTMFGPGIDGLRAIAETDVEVCVGGPDTLERLAYWPRVMRNIVVQLGNRILRIEQELEGLASTNARARLARVLHALAREAAEEWPGGGRRINALPTHESLAHQIGVTRETVTRLLTKLTADGIIRRDGRHAIVTDLNRLAAEFSGER
jgi:CRP-like cAMP-binding protein